MEVTTGHFEKLHDITDGIKQLLTPEGTFVVQGSYLPSILDNSAFDVMYHEHLLLYRSETLDLLLVRHGLKLFDFKLYPRDSWWIICSLCGSC